MSLPTYMIAENPLAEKSLGREFIIHTKSPKMILEVIEVTDLNDEEKSEFISSVSANGAITQVDGAEFIIFPVDVCSENKQTYPPEKIAGMMRRAADWWHAYIKWENDLQ